MKKTKKMSHVLWPAPLAVAFFACTPGQSPTESQAVATAVSASKTEPPGKVPMGKEAVCHVSKDDGHVKKLWLPPPAVQAHLGHGDFLPSPSGSCTPVSDSCPCWDAGFLAGLSSYGTVGCFDLSEYTALWLGILAYDPVAGTFAQVTVIGQIAGTGGGSCQRVALQEVLTLDISQTELNACIADMQTYCETNGIPWY